MRKYLFISIAALLAGAALLIPTGGGAALPTGNDRYTAVAPSAISVSCAPRATTGAATFTVRADSSNSSSTRLGSQADRILVSWGTSTTAQITTLGTAGAVTVTDSAFPCPTTSTTPSSVSFVFQPQDLANGVYVNQGDRSTVSVATARTASAS